MSVGNSLATLSPADLIRTIEIAEDGSVEVMGTPVAALETNDRLALRAVALSFASLLQTVVRGIETTIAADMAEDGATELFHPDYAITYVGRKGDPLVHAELLYTELTRLANAGKCDPAIVAKAVQRVESVVYKTHGTYLKQLAKFGGEVVDVLASGIRPAEVGPPVLVIKAKS